MKKIILTIICAIALVTGVSAQSMGKGKSVLYLGIGSGFGYSSDLIIDNSGYSYSHSPMMHIGYEYGISEDAIPQSIIGIGPHVSTWFAGQKYRNGAGEGFNERWSDVAVMAKGFYHHKFLVGEKWDVYGIVALGVRIRSYHYENVNGYVYNDHGDGSVNLITGIGVGGRYYFGKTFGVYAELDGGLNFSTGQIGIAFKFN